MSQQEAAPASDPMMEGLQDRDPEIEAWFTYHKPTDEQQTSLVAVREQAKMLAYTIKRNTPKSADQTAALRKLREVVMTANAAIVLDGKVPNVRR